MDFYRYFYIILLCPIVTVVTSSSWRGEDDTKLSDNKKFAGGDSFRYAIEQERVDGKKKSRAPKSSIAKKNLNTVGDLLSNPKGKKSEREATAVEGNKGLGKKRTLCLCESTSCCEDDCTSDCSEKCACPTPRPPSQTALFPIPKEPPVVSLTPITPPVNQPLPNTGTIGLHPGRAGNVYILPQGTKPTFPLQVSPNQGPTLVNSNPNLVNGINSNSNQPFYVVPANNGASTNANGNNYVINGVPYTISNQPTINWDPNQANLGSQNYRVITNNVGNQRPNQGTLYGNQLPNGNNQGINYNQGNIYNPGTNFGNNQGTNYNLGTNFNNQGTNSNNQGTNFNNQGTNSNSQGTNSNNQGTISNNQGTNSNNQGTNINNQGTNSNNQGTNSNNQGTNFNNKGTNFNNQGTNSNNQRTNSNNQGTISNNQGTNSNNQGTNLNNQGTSSNNQETFTPNLVPSSAINAPNSLNPQTNPQNPSSNAGNSAVSANPQSGNPIDSSRQTNNPFAPGRGLDPQTGQSTNHGGSSNPAGSTNPSTSTVNQPGAVNQPGTSNTAGSASQASTGSANPVGSTGSTNQVGSANPQTGIQAVPAGQSNNPFAPGGRLSTTNNNGPNVQLDEKENEHNEKNSEAKPLKKLMRKLLNKLSKQKSGTNSVKDRESNDFVEKMAIAKNVLAKQKLIKKQVPHRFAGTKKQTKKNFPSRRKSFRKSSENSSRSKKARFQPWEKVWKKFARDIS
ncbi:putative uncharacterized protein DDB_G0286901 [Dendronephthya gigantea]|uniref:putative uncharacterized protein DDB_G0286901 n=1 Tax=Dendronephthya gigantea TaxID=151771 RepID=UPI00106BF7C2|nr:putative uncharacterized protein DDB_G0286901 [Dendronephthya gigantea]